jgi:hypothetical protein
MAVVLGFSSSAAIGAAFQVGAAAAANRELGHEGGCRGGGGQGKGEDGSTEKMGLHGWVLRLTLWSNAPE